MKIHYLQHVPFEDLANIEPWAISKGHQISRTQLFAGETLPKTDVFDWLIVLGGPMNIYEEKEYPWLAPEKKLIEASIKKEKRVLGICLGAQLIADVLGGPVTKNAFKEIGWFPVALTSEAAAFSIFKTMPRKFTAFHWHGDTFKIPPGALRLAESEGCPNQAFQYRKHVLGLQFHLESSAKSIERLIENCGDEIAKGKYIQTSAQMLEPKNLFEINPLLCELLGRMVNVV